MSSLFPACGLIRADYSPRIRSESQLLPLAVDLANECGITRVSKLTGLDRVALPCYQATRCDAMAVPGNISIYSGSGWTDASAKLSAIFEAIERYWSENPLVNTTRASATTLLHGGTPFLKPEDVPLPIKVVIGADELLEWVEGESRSGDKIWLPAHEIYCPYRPHAQVNNPPIWRSNGIALGASHAEAAYFALLEVIERDAVAIATLAKHSVRSVDLDSFDQDSLGELLRHLREWGISVHIKALSALCDVPVFLVALDDTESPDPLLLVGGYGAHPNPIKALERALFEALQTRAVLISGAREDFERYQARRSLSKEACKAEMAWIYGESEERGIKVNSLPITADVEDMLDKLCEDLSQQGYDCFFVQLTPADYPLTVVRALVAGASHITDTHIRLGKRVKGF